MVIVFVVILTTLGSIKKDEESVEQSKEAHTYLTSFLALRVVLLFIMTWACMAVWGCVVGLKPLQQEAGSRDFLLLISAAGLVLYVTFASVAVISCMSKHNASECGGSPQSEMGAIMANLVMYLFETFAQIGVLLAASRRDLDTLAAIRSSWLRGRMRLLGYMNMLLWFCDTFYDIHTGNSISTQAIALRYYSRKTWLIILRLTYPLMIFFHFHSALYFHELNKSDQDVVQMHIANTQTGGQGGKNGEGSDRGQLTEGTEPLQNASD